MPERRSRAYFRIRVLLPSLAVSSFCGDGPATCADEVNLPSQRKAEVRPTSTAGVDVGLRLIQDGGGDFGAGDTSEGSQSWYMWSRLLTLRYLRYDM